MTEYKTQEALEYYGDKVSYIKIEKDYGCEHDSDIAIYINLYDNNDRPLNSYEARRFDDEDDADRRVNIIAIKYKKLGYEVNL